MEYFISDFHFGHKLMCKTRKFNTLEEHDNFLIESFNNKVSKEDTTYILGDFSWKNPREYLNKLNGKLILIEGNHDKKFESHNLIYIKGYYDIKLYDQYITLCHFPMYSWEKSHYNSWHLFGHHHSKLDIGGKTLNVSVDNLDAIPISFEELKLYMDSRPNNKDYIGDRNVLP